jgi:hypothetical protein
VLSPKEYLRLVIAHENLKCAEILQLKDESNLIVVFRNLTAILQVYIALPITSCEAERNFSKPSLIKNKILSRMLEERLSYLSVLSIQNITKSLSYEDMIKEYAVKKCRGKKILQKWDRQLINKHIILFFCIL